VLASPDQGIGRGETHIDWLFHKHVFPVASRGAAEFTVGSRWGADAHGLQRRVGQELFEIGMPRHMESLT
jgi:hypothetical protein